MKKAVVIMCVLFVVSMSLNAQIIEITTPGSTTRTPVMSGEYNVMNNVWGSGTGVGTQTCEVDISSTYWRVILSEHNSSDVASYPSIFKGKHWDWATTINNPMPIRVDQIDAAPFTWIIDTTGASGTFNCAYESWFSDSPTGTNYTAELMIWINYEGGAGPGGSRQDTVEIGGLQWEVYYALWNWNYIAYKLLNVTDSVSLDLKDFIRDSAIRGWVFTPWYLHNMEAGFEIWRGGQGLATLEYSADVTEGSFSENFVPTPFKLVHPSNNRSMNSKAIPFRWQTSLDGNADPVEYIFHLYGPNVDTTISQLFDDSLYYDGTTTLDSYSYYTWEVKATDGSDTTICSAAWRFRTPVSTGIALSDQVPDRFTLGQNYPNPFNPVTTISYTLPQATTVTLTIVDPTGCAIATPVDRERKEAGTYTVSFDASDLPSGVYFYRIQTEQFGETKKMVLIK